MNRITEVRPATEDDVWDVARIHKARFCDPDLALGQFSVSLISKLYASYLGKHVFLVHVSDRGIDGFVVGGEREELFRAERAFVRKHLIHCGLEILLRPRLWSNIYRFLRKVFLPRTPDFVRYLSPELPRLLSVAVDKSAEGSGAATALVKAFESSISNRYPGYWLSVAKTNRRAVQFYEKLGMTIVVDAFPTFFIFARDFEPSDDGSPLA